ncbi:MAG: peptidylprolyl isomerase [Rhodospirillaceae bacterium]|nr:peptidylprolyl isomerase [Rhodospirillaceae bacterium]
MAKFALRTATAIVAVVMAAGAFVAAPADVRAAEDQTDDVVVARVGKQEIMLSEVVARVVSLPAKQQKDNTFDELYEKILDDLIDQTVVINAAREAGVEDSDQYAQRMKQIADQVLRDMYLTDRVRQRMDPEMVRAKYEELKAQTEPQVEIHARHILVQTEEEAKAIRQEIMDGADFVEMAKEKSIEPGAAQSGGDLGFFSKQQMVAPFSEAAFALEDGEVSEPVQTQFGWHVIKVESRRTREFPPFEQVQDEIMEHFARGEMQQILTELKNETKIERFNREGKPLPAEDSASGDAPAATGDQ